MGGVPQSEKRRESERDDQFMQNRNEERDGEYLRDRFLSTRSTERPAASSRANARRIVPFRQH